MTTGNRVPLCEPSPIDNINPRLPRVGDRFETWDDFRTWSRKAAEARGFTLSQSQSKGSSGTIVLRCSRFKEPGAVGQRMAENGCEVVFKVMNARNGGEGFEVVHAIEEHNHPFGPDIPTGHRVGTPLSGQPPKKKKAKSAAATHESVAPASATPPASNSKPFKYDPYTGKPLRSSTTPMPSGSTPSPPTHPDHQPIQQHATTTTTATTSAAAAPRPISHAPSSIHDTPRSHSSRAGSRPSSYPNPNPVVPPQPEGYSATLAPHTQPSLVININPEQNHVVNSGGGSSKNYAGSATGLSIRLSLKAQTSITEFLTSLSPSLTSYGNHFKWIGIHSPYDLLEIIQAQSQDEFNLFLDEIDTCGIGAKGEGLSVDEKFLILRGLHKLSSLKK